MASRQNGKPKPAYEPPGCLFSGVGSPQPQSRQLTGGMFGHLPDAFDSKTLDVGVGETPYQQRSRVKQEEEEGGSEMVTDDNAQVENGADEPDAEPVPEEEEEVVHPKPVFEAVS